MRIPAILTKIKSTHNNLRTDVIDGWFSTSPVEGKFFQFYAPPLYAPSGVRIITTTDVKTIDEQSIGTILFQTENSTYRLTTKCADAIKVTTIKVTK